MESLNQRRKKLTLALIRLSESLHSFETIHDQNLHQQIRDSLLKRFEFSFELFWKCLKDYLFTQHGVVAVSPRSVFREANLIKLLSDEEYELAYKMVDDRNTCAHAYDETLAQQVAEKIKSYYIMMIKVTKEIQKNHE